MAHHSVHLACVLEDGALQVSNVIMMEDQPCSSCATYSGKWIWTSQEWKDQQVSSILSSSSMSVLAIQNDQVVVYKWTHCKSSIQSFEYANKMSRMLTLKIQNEIWCQQNQLCFVHIVLTLVCCTIATRKGNSYRACDEEMLKPLLIHSFEEYQYISMVYLFRITIDTM